VLKELENNAENFIDKGLQKETINELKEALNDYPNVVKSSLDKNKYWSEGRGKEIIQQFSGIQKNEVKPKKYFSPDNKVKEYWSNGRGAEILKMFSEFDTKKFENEVIEKSVAELENAVKEKIDSDFKAIEIIPTEKISNAAMDSTKFAERLLKYSANNVKKTVIYLSDSVKKVDLSEIKVIDDSKKNRFAESRLERSE